MEIDEVLEKLKAMNWLREPFCDMDIKKLTKQFVDDVYILETEGYETE